MKSGFIYLLFISLLFSCKKEDTAEESNPVSPNASVSGKAQLGPFKNGADVVINELDNKLEQTGNSYSAIINKDDGSFSLENITLSTSIASVSATGYYYMVPFNLQSPYKIYLEAVADVQSSSVINVNLLTHLIKPRIEKLVADGTGFSTAKAMAQEELKTFLHASASDTVDFEDLNFINSNFLFAASLLFQRRTITYSASYNYVNELNHLLNSFRSDFMDNGQINSQNIIDTLIYNANRIELISDKAKLESYMNLIGTTTFLMGFEQYIYNFQKAYSLQLYANYVFPDPATYERDFKTPTTYPNILFETNVNFTLVNCMMSAIVPIDSSLVIKLTILSPSQYTFGGYNYGWQVTTLSDGFSLEAQRKNYPNAFWVNLWDSGNADSARVEYFKNNQAVPYLSKIIYW